jgi:hypothetical protein
VTPHKTKHKKQKTTLRKYRGRKRIRPARYETLLATLHTTLLLLLVCYEDNVFTYMQHTHTFTTMDLFTRFLAVGKN